MLYYLKIKLKKQVVKVQAENVKFEKQDQKSLYRSIIKQNSTNCDTENGAQPDKNNAFLRCFKSVLGFINKHRRYLVSALIIVATFFCVLFCHSVYPFGEISISNYDLLAQICPFIEHLFDVLDGRASLFYTTAIAGGADVFGTIAYCLISPFTWVFLLFGRGNCYYATSIVIPLKLVAICFSALYYISKHHKKLNDHIAITVAILYAFCGYTFVSNTYVNWLDFLIYMPFVVSGFKKLITDGKILHFSISYALMIYTCFSIACFALLIVYLIAVVYVLLVVEDKKQVLTKLCLAFVLSVGLALPIMLPAFMAYIRSGRNTGLFENINNPLETNHLYRKLTYIFSDCLFLFLSAVYFIKNGVKRPIDKFLAITGALIFAPVLIDECCNLLNTGSYMSYALRFGFLNAFYMLYLSLKVLDGFEKTETTTKRNLIFGSILSLLCVVCMGLMIYVINDRVQNGTYDFTSKFAHSEGGLETIIIIACAIFVVLTVATLFYRFKLVSRALVCVILTSVFLAQFALYNVSLVNGNTFNPLRYDQYNQIVNAIKTNGEDQNEYYRIKDTADALTACAPLTTHTNSFSVFSSVIDAQNFVATDFFGYMGNGVNTMKSARGMFFGDILLGYKYYYHHYDGGALTKNDSYISKPYVELLDYAQMENFTGFINNAAFPTAFLVSGESLDFTGLTKAEQLNALYTYLGGQGDFLYAYTFKESEVIHNEHDSSFTLKVRLREEGHWYVESKLPDEFDVHYCAYTTNFTKENAQKVDGTIELAYHIGNNNYYSVTVKDYNNKLTKQDVLEYFSPMCASVYKVYEPKDGDTELYDIVMQNKVDMQIVNGNKFVINATATEEFSNLFLSYVALDGFTVYVNGKQVEFAKNDLKLMSVPLEIGENQVVIKYRTPYLKYIVYGLIGALLISFAVYLITKKAKILKTFEGIIYPTAFVLAFIVLGFFFIYPTSVFLVKLVKLLINLII